MVVNKIRKISVFNLYIDRLKKDTKIATIGAKHTEPKSQTCFTARKMSRLCNGPACFSTVRPAVRMFRCT